MTSKRDSAVALATQGSRIFPLVPNGKTPALEGNWRKIASSNPIRVAEMWTCPVTDAELDYNIGIALDANTLVVDVDVRGDKVGAKSLAMLEAINDEMPATDVVITPTGGEHRYFNVPGNSGSFPKTLATDIDLKGEGGYVVGPGSEIDGKTYSYVRGGGLRGPEPAQQDGSTASDPRTPRAHAPDWLLRHADEGTRTRVRQPALAGDAVTGVDTPDAIARAIEWLENHAPEANEGEGGDFTTVKVANHVGDFGISSGQALDLMLDHWNDTKANPSWDHDDLAAKVHSAFKSRQNAIGIRNPEAEFDAVEVDTTIQPPKGRGLYAIRWKDATPDLEQQFLIDDVVDLGVMVVTYGDSNVGKTYVKLDQCFHIASGKDWNGHKVKQGLVVYVAAEGGKGFLKRMQAFKIHYGVTDLPFSLVPCPIDLQSEQADTAKLVKLIREEEAHFGQKCVLIVIDTLARAMSGGDENTAVDMSKFVGHSDRLRAATGATVDVIHHTGKDKAKGARGSSALRAATDTEIEIGEGVFEAKKQRDMAKGEPINFELINIDVGERSDGKKVTACVVRWVERNEFDDRLSPGATEMMRVLERLVEGRRDEIEEDESIAETDKRDMLKSVRIPWAEWQMSCLSCNFGARGKPLKRTALFPLRQELSDSGKAKKDKSNQWFLG